MKTRLLKKLRKHFDLEYRTKELIRIKDRKTGLVHWVHLFKHSKYYKSPVSRSLNHMLVILGTKHKWKHALPLLDQMEIKNFKRQGVTSQNQSTKVPSFKEMIEHVSKTSKYIR